MSPMMPELLCNSATYFVQELDCMQHKKLIANASFVTSAWLYRVAKFNGVHTLILHIPENFGADHTQITFIGIKGEFTEVGLLSLVSLTMCLIFGVMCRRSCLTMLQYTNFRRPCADHHAWNEFEYLLIFAHSLVPQ